MKKLLAIASLYAVCATNSQAGPSWGFTLNDGTGFYWNSRRHVGSPMVMPYYRERFCYPRQVIFAEPRYHQHWEVRSRETCSGQYQQRVLNYQH